MSRIARPPQFSIATILLVTTLAAVCLAAFYYHPCLGTVVLVVSLPSLARALFVGRSRQQAGEAVRVGAKVELFVVSLLVTLLALGSAAFVLAVANGLVDATVGTPLGYAVIEPFSLLVAAIAALGTFLFVFWRFTFPLDLR